MNKLTEEETDRLLFEVKTARICAAECPLSYDGQREITIEVSLIDNNYEEQFAGLLKGLVYNLKRSSNISCEMDETEEIFTIWEYLDANRESLKESKSFDYVAEPFIYIDDLTIQEEYRGKGLAQYIIKHLDKIIQMTLPEIGIPKAAFWYAFPNYEIDIPDEERDETQIGKEIERLAAFSEKIEAEKIDTDTRTPAFAWFYGESNKRTKKKVKERENK